MNYNKYFHNARILYLDSSPNYYALSIKKSIERQGGQVDFTTFENKTFFTRVLHNTNNKLWLANKAKFLKKQLIRLKSNNYDFIFVKAAHDAPIQFIEELANTFHNSVKISYHWNSVKLNNYLQYLKYFDYSFSFDPDDCNRYDITYYPLFFIDEYRDSRENIIKCKKDIDIIFIGLGYSEGRYNFLRELEMFCNKKNIINYFYLYSSRYTKYKNIIKGKLIPNIKHKYLTHQEIIELYSRSKVVIDHPMDIQSGLTMRTFETLGSGLRLITTNKKIKETDLYDERNVQCIDDVDEIDINFIRNPRSNIINNIDNYHIDKWVQHVLPI